jgi:hypothetical protein
MGHSAKKEEGPARPINLSSGTTMSDWLAHFSGSLADQVGTWFAGSVVLAVLGAFSGRLVEKVKFALNRADARIKYYEQLATDISHFVFIIDRTVKVYYGSTWASADDKGAIAAEYNEIMNKICRDEYVYLSWLNRYWGKHKTELFKLTMANIKRVDAVLIDLNEHPKNKAVLITQLTSEFNSLTKAAHDLLETDST